MRFQTLRVLYEGRRGLAAGSHSSNSTAPLLGVFCASPSQIRRFVPRGVRAVPCRGLVMRGQVVAQGEQVPFRGHRFIHPLQSRISDGMCLGLPVLPLLLGGSPGGWWHLRVSQVDDKCQRSSPRVQMLAGLHALACGFFSGRSTGTPPLEEDFGDNVCVQTHIVIALSHSASMASHSATLCVSPAFP